MTWVSWVIATFLAVVVDGIAYGTGFFLGACAGVDDLRAAQKHEHWN